MGGAIVYKSKTQSLTADSSTEAEFIAAHAAAKIARYLRMLLKQLGYEQKDPTPIHIDNLPALRMTFLMIILLPLRERVTSIIVSSRSRTGELMVKLLCYTFQVY